MHRPLRSPIAIALLALTCGPGKPVLAQDGSYDIDCATLLCLAGGFPVDPSGTCADAYGYMIDRITDIPPKPPFGVCAMADGSAYESYDLDYAINSRLARNAYACPDGGSLYFRTGKWGTARAFCYMDVAEVMESDGLCYRVYESITEATFRQMDAQLVFEPGTSSEYAAPPAVVDEVVAAPARFEELCDGTGLQ